MASGWAPDGAVQDQIDGSISDAVRLARSRLPSGPGGIHCEECGEEIPEARRLCDARRTALRRLPVRP
jgi:RNA polymerase-binding transcription factor DksA